MAFFRRTVRLGDEISLVGLLSSSIPLLMHEDVINTWAAQAVSLLRPQCFGSQYFLPLLQGFISHRTGLQNNQQNLRENEMKF